MQTSTGIWCIPNTKNSFSHPKETKFFKASARTVNFATIDNTVLARDEKDYGLIAQ